jgi:hypothetical protein
MPCIHRSRSFTGVAPIVFLIQSIRFTQIPQLWLRFACSPPFARVRSSDRFAIFYPNPPIVASFRVFFSFIFLSSVIWRILGFDLTDSARTIPSEKSIEHFREDEIDIGQKIRFLRDCRSETGRLIGARPLPQALLGAPPCGLRPQPPEGGPTSEGGVAGVGAGLAGGAPRSAPLPIETVQEAGGARRA